MHSAVISAGGRTAYGIASKNEDDLHEAAQIVASELEYDG
jgi:hypothetical protein